MFSLFQFLLPLIIEKLDSDVQSAKLDSLQTLVRNLCYFPKFMNVDDTQLIFPEATQPLITTTVELLRGLKYSITSEGDAECTVPGFLSHHT